MFKSHIVKLPRVVGRKFKSTTLPSSNLLFNIDHMNMHKILYNQYLKSVDLDSHLDIGLKKSMTKTIIELNRDKSLDNLFRRRYWDIQMFDDMNLPIVISNLNNPHLFQKKNHTQFFWLLDLPIKMPGINWKIPTELLQFSEFIIKCVHYEKLINPNIDDYYAYLSVDQRQVNPGQSQRRPGWHSDSFITESTRKNLTDSNVPIDVDSIYLAYNCLPTEFCSGPFTFDHSFDHNNNADVLNHFEQMSKGLKIVTYPPFTILKIKGIPLSNPFFVFQFLAYLFLKR